MQGRFQSVVISRGATLLPAWYTSTAWLVLTPPQLSAASLVLCTIPQADI